jgi:L-alanine-DL-glutamate epimerase-like enolase superfamily enzyme
MMGPAIRIEQAEAFLLRYRLEHPVGGSGVSVVDVVVATLADAEGVAGLGFTYVIGGGGEVVLAAARGQLQQHVHGHVLPPPAALWRRIAAGFNRSGLGPNLVALAAIDVAAWDLDARRRGVPLGVAMGGAPREVRVYGSGGFTAAQAPEAAVEAALSHVARGLRAVKPRVRGDRADLALLAAVRGGLPAEVDLMVDANEKCDLAAAKRLMQAAQDHGVLFVEEPLPSAALHGYRSLAASGVGIAAGEHLQGRSAFLPYLSERLISVAQPDLAMAGGLTPILEIAVLAEALDVSVSPHFLPGLFVHVAAAAPAVTWLEDFPLVEPLFDGWPPIQPNGAIEARTVPGHGLALSADVRTRYEMR